MSSILIQGEMIRLAAVTAVTSPIDHGNHNAARYHLKASFDVYGIAGTGGRRFIFDGIEDARQEHKRLLQALGWFNEFLETTTDPAYIPVMPSKLKPGTVVPLDRDGHLRTCAYMPERPCSCVIGSPCPNLHVRSTVIQDRARRNFDRD